jgi:hypothetical protein
MDDAVARTGLGSALMTSRTSSPRLPGRWLEAIARAVFDEPALSHAALPAIADFQQEWIEYERANPPRRTN